MTVVNTENAYIYDATPENTVCYEPKEDLSFTLSETKKTVLSAQQVVRKRLQSPLNQDIGNQNADSR